MALGCVVGEAGLEGDSLHVGGAEKGSLCLENGGRSPWGPWLWHLMRRTWKHRDWGRVSSLGFFWVLRDENPWMDLGKEVVESGSRQAAGLMRQGLGQRAHNSKVSR